MNQKKRLGIFLFFDEEGCVHPYVEFLLKDILENLDTLVIVCNGILSAEGRSILKKYSDHIIVRQNRGFDVGGFREALVEQIGLEAAAAYDEIVLLNDSFFGPIYPFKEVFAEMDQRTALDFWGLSSHGETPNVYGMCPYGYRPRYLQTYFLVFRKRLTSSDIFREFWSDMPEFHTFEEAAENFGCVFTKKFEDAGYQWAAYSDTSDLESETREKNMSFHTFNLYDMVANRRFPILKRKTFITNKSITLRYNWGGDLSKTLQYVKTHTTYDLRLIYQYLLKMYNLDDLKKNLNLTVVLPEQDLYGGKELYQGKRVAMIAHLFYPELFGYDLAFLQNLPPSVDLILTVSEETKKQQLEAAFRPHFGDRLRIVMVKSRGRDLSALLVGCQDFLMEYDYVGFIHDKKSAQKEYITVGSAFCDLLWENTLYSEGYIRNLLNHFEENPCLGLLVPPNVYHGTYFSSAKNYWTTCFTKTLEVARSIGVTIDLDPQKEPFSVGSVFWCRTEALHSIFEAKFKYTDFPGEPLPGDGTISHAMERIFPYVAQQNGYYTEHVMHAAYAATELTNYRMMHVDTMKALIGMPYVQFATHYVFINSCKKSVAQFQQLRRTAERLRIVQTAPAQAAPGGAPETVVCVDIGLKGAFLNFADKKFPKGLAKLLHKLLKY